MDAGIGWAKSCRRSTSRSATRSAGATLDRVILPERWTFARPEATRRGRCRSAWCATRAVSPGRPPRSGVRLVGLAEWAETAPSPWIESLSGAWCGPAGGGDDAEVLLLGPAGRLPAAEGGTRFWGTDVLIPLGYRAEPELADRAVRNAVGAGPDDLVILESGGLELIPRKAFRPLCRAGIRLALLEMSRGRAGEEARP